MTDEASPGEYIIELTESVTKDVNAVSVSSGGMEALFAEFDSGTDRLSFTDGATKVDLEIRGISRVDDRNLPQEVNFGVGQTLEGADGEALDHLLQLIDSGFHVSEGYGTRAYWDGESLYLDVKPYKGQGSIYKLKLGKISYQNILNS